MKTQKQFAEIKIKDVMSNHVQTLMCDDTIQDAVALMIDNKFSTIPVVDAHDKCIGILSRSDVTEIFLREDHELARVLDTDRLSMDWIQGSLETCEIRQVKELMTYDVAQIRETQSISDACREMARNEIHHLPVVDEEGRVMGILSTLDIVKAVAESE
jgi:CBS-domain-containing membrane protein